MRILIDECLDPGIRDVLAGHEVTTVGEAKWQSTADNQLIQLAAGNFDVLLTLDRGFEFQHNLEKAEVWHRDCASQAQSPRRL